MIHKIKTYTTVGLEGYEIIVEVDSNKSLPMIEIIGLPDTAIKEAKERIRSTFRNVGLDLPNRKIILNLAPSDIRKIGTSFDLPMAVSILALFSDSHISHGDLMQSGLFFGELGLDGMIKRVNGLLPMVISALRQGYTTFFIPIDNSFELEYIEGIVVYPLAHFSQLVDFFLHAGVLIPLVHRTDLHNLTLTSSAHQVDFADIKGQMVAKRALCIAAAGIHNVLMVGAPGSGKTLLSKALQSILPPLQPSEILEVSQIYSIVGKLTKEQPLITTRPFRAIHHTASRVSIVGGGQLLRPGEISLAHRGILFLDELPEFPRETLEVLRQPLEDHKIVISRAVGSIQYPASFMMVAAMNPCKCGYYKDPEKSCICGMFDIAKYQSRISGPLLDRIDMILEIPREKIDRLLDKSSEESSESLKIKVQVAREQQQKRFVGTPTISNSQIIPRDIHRYLIMETAAEDFLKQASKQLTLSPRVVHRLMKLSRTIADMEQSDLIHIQHIAESLHYRSKTMFVEGG